MTATIKAQQDFGLIRRIISRVQTINATIRNAAHPSIVEVNVMMRDAELAYIQRELEDIAHIEDGELDELRETARSLLVEDIRS